VILVLDSSALITLARIGRLDLLRQVAGTVHIPEAVYEEVVQPAKGATGVRRSPRRNGFRGMPCMIDRPSRACDRGSGEVKLRPLC
jgi:hypothetical protein